MSNINFNSIYDGVTLALHAAFPKSKVHGGDVRQDLSSGDFNVVMPGADHTKEVGHRYRRTPSLDVLYYPKARPCAAECYDVAHRLMNVLGSITTPEGDTIHASSLKWQMQDNVLHVLVEYAHCVYIPQVQEAMDTLKIEQEG